MTKPLVVLVADEEPAIRELLKDYLTELDLRVVLASHGDEVLEALHRTHVDIVLIDLNLPGPYVRSIFDTAVRQRPELKQRFIFMGPYAGGTAGAEFGGIELAKPFRFEDLARALQTIRDHIATQRPSGVFRAGEAGA